MRGVDIQPNAAYAQRTSTKSGLSVFTRKMGNLSIPLMQPEATGLRSGVVIWQCMPANNSPLVRSDLIAEIKPTDGF